MQTVLFCGLVWQNDDRMIALAKNSMQKLSKVLDSLHYLSSVVCVDQKIICPYLSALLHFIIGGVIAFI